MGTCVHSYLSSGPLSCRPCAYCQALWDHICDSLDRVRRPCFLGVLYSSSPYSLSVSPPQGFLGLQGNLEETPHWWLRVWRCLPFCTLPNYGSLHYHTPTARWRISDDSWARCWAVIMAECCLHFIAVHLEQNNSVGFPRVPDLSVLRFLDTWARLKQVSPEWADLRSN